MAKKKKFFFSINIPTCRNRIFDMKPNFFWLFLIFQYYTFVSDIYQWESELYQPNVYHQSQNRFKNVYTFLLIIGQILSRKTTRGGRALSFLNILLSQFMLYFLNISAEVFLCHTFFFVTFVMRCGDCVWKYKLSWK